MLIFYCIITKIPNIDNVNSYPPFRALDKNAQIGLFSGMVLDTDDGVCGAFYEVGLIQILIIFNQ